jgi:predicted polyphosphate/ATP-dependent NAD kinase
VKLGLIVNPIAGMGGCVALKGTDGGAVLAEARRRGAEALAPARALRALARLAGAPVEVLAPLGIMGGDIARAAGFDVTLIQGERPAETTAEDTRRAAAILRAEGAALILFAGGDGTARDVLAAVGGEQPILGIPAGVKMQSGVFAIGPEAAGELAALMAANPDGRIVLREAEVMDIDEAAARAGSLSARLYGYARVPFERRLMQSPKAGGPSEDAALDALCREVALEMAEDAARDALYILGPGTTTRRVLNHLGLEGSLLGVDAVLDRRLLGRDLARADLAALAARHPPRIILGVIGGQGYTFGRGNQQIGPEIIRAAGRDNITLLASQRKILALGENRLLADTGDPAVDALLRGHIRVRLAPGLSTMMRVDA